MKKIISLLIAVMLIALLFGCGKADAAKTVPASFDDSESVKQYLLEQNAAYIKSNDNSGDISSDKRSDTAANGQHPYAVVVTCSDSRVPAEHIFNAGIGELFVIRTAGNVIGDFELGSVEYGAEHLGAKLVVVLGHTNCGAVDAAINGGAHGYIETITDEISACLTENCGPREAEKLNVANSIQKILSSKMMRHLVEENAVSVVGAIYDITSGEVSFLD